MSVKTAPSVPRGTYNLDLSCLNHPEDELIAMRYAFKPASVTHTTSGTYYPSQGSSSSQPVQVVFDIKNGSQVFDVREETTKGRECVMIFNEENNAFELYPLSTTLHLTLNRNASHTYAASTSSTSSSSSVPLAVKLHTAQEAPPEISNPAADERDEEGIPRPMKRVKTAIAEKRERDKGTSSSQEDASRLKGNRGVGKGGKSLPRNKPLESAPIPVIGSARTRSATNNVKNKSGKGKSTGAKGKAKGKKAETTIYRKVKSAEYIEDSDEEIGASEEVQLPPSSARKPRPRGKEIREQEEEEEAEEEEDAMDEFANLLGQSLAEGGDYSDADAEGEDEFEEVLTKQLQQQYAQNDAGLGYDDEDDEESESEDEDDDLGGARLVVRQSGVMDDGSEWI
ncbi:hypothetical protein I305_01811 [Cryptococcus gattii E566]|uniref:Transcription elongation factor Eaf N-terminal domain-containing protein n=1 Tax=Cryptococcus gattii serotype B (strain WM276 / ATCC MYA-4071) TaxID=367775 RepID=E6R3Y3_CRYGW|nr:Hypothetical protein CGB_D4560W [Cryptococcus gattii WM276]ADV21774.1 Hypothetical protein CGB_D4560W [Cryptococcus gattii WM276]KIY35562.1 hypothetical protein I305_01811 [Cryptococcus gattii E566]